MIHYCPHCNTKCHIPGDHEDPQCPDILCGKRASEAKLVKADFKTRFRAGADRDRLEGIARGIAGVGEVRARIFVEVNGEPGAYKHAVLSLTEARDLLEPFERHLIPLRDVAPVEEKLNSGRAVVARHNDEVMRAQVASWANRPEGAGEMGQLLELRAQNELLKETVEGLKTDICNESLEKAELGQLLRQWVYLHRSDKQTPLLKNSKACLRWVDSLERRPRNDLGPTEQELFGPRGAMPHGALVVPKGTFSQNEVDSFNKHFNEHRGAIIKDWPGEGVKVDESQPEHIRLMDEHLKKGILKCSPPTSMLKDLRNMKLEGSQITILKGRQVGITHLRDEYAKYLEYKKACEIEKAGKDKP